MKFTCQKCGTEFNRSPSRKSAYCSRSCAGNARRSEQVICKQCGVEFEADVIKKRQYCSRECAGLAHQTNTKEACLNCGQEIKIIACKQGLKHYCSRSCAASDKRVRKELKCQTCQTKFYPTKDGMKFCSPECSYASNPRKGYKSISISTVPVEEQELFKEMFGKKGACHEHRLIIARKLGRCLTSTEIVHHLNGNKRDNRPENLELLESKKKHHTGYGDVYYQQAQEAESKLQDAEVRIKELEKQLAGVV